MTNWEAIVENDGPAVWRILWRLLADREDVEECFQETFVAALQLARRQTVHCWPALLCSLATARAMDLLRKRYRQAGRAHANGHGSNGPSAPAMLNLRGQVPCDLGNMRRNAFCDPKIQPGRRTRLAEATSSAAGPAEQAVALELSERLRAALGQLPERQAEVFYLHALCGWSHRDLGEHMHMTDNAVGVTIHRARQRLRDPLSDGQ